MSLSTNYDGSSSNSAVIAKLQTMCQRPAHNLIQESIEKNTNYDGSSSNSAVIAKLQIMCQRPAHNLVQESIEKKMQQNIALVAITHALMTQKQPLSIENRVVVSKGQGSPRVEEVESEESNSKKDVSKKVHSYNPFDVEKDVSDTNPFSEKNLLKNGIGKQNDADVSRKPFVFENRVSNGVDWNREWTGSDLRELSSETYDVESKQSLFQTLTQRKVLIVAGTALVLIAGGAAAAAAYSLYPVAAAAHMGTAMEIGSIVAMGAHAGVAAGVINTMLIADVLMKVAVFPAAKVTATAILPMVSTAVMMTLGTFALLYVGNKVWEASKIAMYSAGSAVANKFGEELDKTYAGQAVKFAALTVAEPYVALLEGGKEDVSLEEESDEQSFDIFSTTHSQGVDKSEEEFASKKSDLEDEITGERIKTQKKTKRTFTENVIRAGLMTAVLGLGGYYVYQMRQG